MQKNVKSIEFELQLEGYGVVNYDGPQQQNIWNSVMREKKNGKYLTDDNNSLGKKNWYGPDGDYKNKISADCLRHALFGEQSTNLVYSKYLFLSYLASPNALLRGYAFLTQTGDNISRKSALSITDAEISNNAASTIEFFSRSGEKSKTSLHVKETLGNTEYQTRGTIDLWALQFIGVDPKGELNLNLNADYFDSYKELLNAHIKNFNSTPAYYTLANYPGSEPVRGAILSNENIVDIVKYMLTELYKLSIRRGTAYAKTATLRCRLISDPVDALENPEQGWKTVNADFINALTFEADKPYKECDFEKVEQLNQEIANNKASELKAKEDKKAEEKKKRDEAKQKKASADSEN